MKNLTRPENCDRKATYGTHAAASRAVREMKKNGELVNDGEGVLRPYKCNVCNGWHVGRSILTKTR